jgi:hypothetical protein
MTFLLSVPPHTTRLAMTTTLTPLRPGTMLKHSPVPPKRWGRGATPYHFGPLAFGVVIRAAPYPRHFWPLTHISKYDGETNPDHRLEDYRLAMKDGGRTMTLPSSTFLYFCRA